MAKNRTIYRKLPMYKLYLARLIQDKETFEVAETSFTKKIKIGTDTFIFNEKGEPDGKVLQLISRVRNDAAGFSLEKLPKEELKNSWFDLTERPEETVIAKVDVKSAYWETALKMGVITEDTNRYLHDTFGKTGEIKTARLKALGSLATKKVIVQYINGVKMHITENTQPTKQLYMYVCSVLDELMQAASYNLAGAFYYYWDCVFVDEQYHKDVMQFLKDAEYSTTVELERLEIIELGTRKYFVTSKFGSISVEPNICKQYPIPQEKLFILNT